MVLGTPGPLSCPLIVVTETANVFAISACVLGRRFEELAAVNLVRRLSWLQECTTIILVSERLQTRRMSDFRQNKVCIYNKRR